MQDRSIIVARPFDIILGHCLPWFIMIQAFLIYCNAVSRELGKNRSLGLRFLLLRPLVTGLSTQKKTNCGLGVQAMHVKVSFNINPSTACTLTYKIIFQTTNRESYNLI